MAFGLERRRIRSMMRAGEEIRASDTVFTHDNTRAVLIVTNQAVYLVDGRDAVGLRFENVDRFGETFGTHAILATSGDGFMFSYPRGGKHATWDWLVAQLR